MSASWFGYAHSSKYLATGADPRKVLGCRCLCSPIMWLLVPGSSRCCVCRCLCSPESAPAGLHAGISGVEDVGACSGRRVAARLDADLLAHPVLEWPALQRRHAREGQGVNLAPVKVPGAHAPAPQADVVVQVHRVEVVLVQVDRVELGRDRPPSWRIREQASSQCGVDRETRGKEKRQREYRRSWNSIWKDEARRLEKGLY